MAFEWGDNTNRLGFELVTWELFEEIVRLVVGVRHCMELCNFLNSPHDVFDVKAFSLVIGHISSGLDVLHHQHILASFLLSVNHLRDTNR